MNAHCYEGTIPGKRYFISVRSMWVFLRFINTGDLNVQAIPSEPPGFETNLKEEQTEEKLKYTYYAC